MEKTEVYELSAVIFLAARLCTFWLEAWWASCDVSIILNVLGVLKRFIGISDVSFQLFAVDSRVKCDALLYDLIFLIIDVVHGML